MHKCSNAPCKHKRDDAKDAYPTRKIHKCEEGIDDDLHAVVVLKIRPGHMEEDNEHTKYRPEPSCEWSQTELRKCIRQKSKPCHGVPTKAT